MLWCAPLLVKDHCAVPRVWRLCAIHATRHGRDMHHTALHIALPLLIEPPPPHTYTHSHTNSHTNSHTQSLSHTHAQSHTHACHAGAAGPPLPRPQGIRGARREQAKVLSEQGVCKLTSKLSRSQQATSVCACMRGVCVRAGSPRWLSARQDRDV